MFTKYVCEECGKMFDSEDKALNCEREHEELKKAAELADAERRSKLDEIVAIETLLKNKIEAYEKTYGLKYIATPTYYNVLADQLGNELNNLIDEMFGA